MKKAIGLTLLGSLLLAVSAGADLPSRIKNLIVSEAMKIGSKANPDSKAVLDVESTTKGFLPPRMTEAQRDAIDSPPAGLLVFNTDTGVLNSFNGGSWTEVGSGGGGSGTGFNNLITNPGAETNTDGWTASGGTFDRTTTAANVGFGAGAFSWDASGAQTLCSSAVDIPAGLFGRAGLAKVIYKGGDTNLSLQARDGSNNVLGTVTLAVTTSYTAAEATFPFPSSGEVKICMVAGADAAIVYFDDAFLGEDFRVGSIAQAELVGTAKVTGCASPWSRGNTSYGDLGTATSCSYAVTGIVAAPDTNLAGFKLVNPKPGKYVVEYEGLVGKTSASSDSCFFRFHDGTNAFDSENYMGVSSNVGVYIPQIGGQRTYTTSPGTITIRVQAKREGGSVNCELYGRDTYPGVFRVYRYPTESETVVRGDTTANWGAKKWFGSVTSIKVGAGSAPSSTRTTISNAALSTYSLFGAAVNDLSTNAQITLSLRPGDYIASYTGFMRSSTQSGGVSTACVFEIHDGTNILASQVFSSLNIMDISHFEGPFKVSSVGEKTYTLRAAKVGGDSGANSYCEIYLDGAQTMGVLTVRPVTQAIPAPFIPGSVFSSSTGVMRTESLTVNTTCSSSPCTVNRSSGAWYSTVSRAGTGNYTININAGMFSVAPTCVCSAESITHVCQSGTVSTTGYQVISALSSTGAAADGGFNIVCFGPR